MAKAPEGQIPVDVYQPFVMSLYAGRPLLLAGMISHAATGLLIAFKLQDPFYAYCSLAIFVIWAARTWHMRGFDLSDEIRDRREISYWEFCYIGWAGAVTLTLGVMCAYSLVFSRDSFAQLASISVTLGTLVSAVGRNYGSRRTVDVITAASCIPIVGGLLLLHDVYSALLALLIGPFIFTIRTMSNGVRAFLYKHVMDRREIAMIAERFDAALNNMPHGLFMLDEDNRILVANRKAGQLLKVPDWNRFRNHSLKAVLRYGVRTGLLTHDQAAMIDAQLAALLSGAESRALIRLSKDLYLEFTAKRRRNIGVVLIFEDVTARIKAEEKITHMARYDGLTGLASRAYFAEVVEDIVRKLPDEEQVALAVLDLDDFKDVNDTKGHLTGDRLLCALATRLRDVAGERAVLSRFGGDEFVLFVTDVKGRGDIEITMDRVLDALRGSYFVNGNKVFVGVSAGVVLSRAGDFRLEAMHIRADLALYESKQNDKNVWTFFAADMDADYRRRQKLKTDLREAISNGSISVAYQPIFSVDDMSIACCEALARWYHPEMGSVSPAVFIGIAEEMGIIGELTRQVLRQACADCMSWPGEIGVAVNLSAVDLRNHDIIAMVKDALRMSGLHPRRLQVEVTESAFVKDSSKAQAVLQELRAMGLTVAIDDFGTGYSSLSYLNVLPLNKVKIDRSFVADITTDERQLKLLRGIVHLSRELGLEIVVEGVETDEQLRLIQRTGSADLIQGFIFGLPMPSSAVLELITSRASRGSADVARDTFSPALSN